MTAQSTVPALGALPDWLDEPKRWMAATERLRDQIVREEEQAVSDLRKLRTFRRFLDAVLGRIERPEAGR